MHRAMAKEPPLIARIADKLRREIREHGYLGALRYIVAWALMAATVVQATPTHQRRVRGLREADRAYDEACDVDTSGILHPDEIGVTSERRRLAVSHVPSLPEEFRRTLGSVPIDHEQFTFVDLGSGKGRAVLLAMEYPFKKVIGVEFSPLLHDVAERNLASYRGSRRCRDVELLLGDAAEWSPPEGPLAVYLYNPFQAEVLEVVVHNLLAAVERSSRELYLFYCNPVHESVLSREPRLERVAQGDLFTVYRAKTA